MSTAVEDTGNVTKLQAQKSLFYSMIKKTADSNNTKMITQKKRRILFRDSLTSKDKLGKKYGWFNKYELFQMGNSEPILFRKKLRNEFLNAEGNIVLEQIRQEATFENLFDILHTIHVAVGHGKVRKMEAAIKQKYSNIGRGALEAFCKVCSVCIEGNPRQPQRAGYRPIITKGLNCLGKIDQIDMKSNCENGMKWLAVYQDHGLKPFRTSVLLLLPISLWNFLQSKERQQFRNWTMVENLGVRVLQSVAAKEVVIQADARAKKKALCAEVDAITRCDAVTNSCVLTPH